MRYPKWFPYPRCWARVLVSTTSIAIAGTVMRFPLLLLWGSTGIIAALTGGWGAILAIPLLALTVAIALGLHAHTRQLLMVVCKLIRKESFSWFWNPPKLFWNESLVDYLTLIFSGSFVFLAYILPRSIILSDPRVSIPLRDAENTVCAIAMVTLAAYINQVRYLVLQHWENKRKRKNKQGHKSQLPRAKRPARAVEDTDQDLNQLRWEQQRERVSPPPSSSRGTVDDELERLKREMEDKG